MDATDWQIFASGSPLDAINYYKNNPEETSSILWDKSRYNQPQAINKRKGESTNYTPGKPCHSNAADMITEIGRAL